MAAKIINKLIQLPPEFSSYRVVDHPHSIELFLSFHVPSLHCKRCGASFSMRPYSVHPTLKLSVSAWLSVSAALMTTRSLRDIVVDNCLTESQMLSVLYAVDVPKPAPLPQTLCIDEFKNSSGVYDKDSGRWNISRSHCNISDGSIGCVADVLLRMDPEYLPACFRDYSPQQRRRVLFCCSNTKFVRETYTNALELASKERRNG